MDYKFRLKPFRHQKKTFDETKDRKGYAIFWEQGTGKTKVFIDTVGYRYKIKGDINRALIIAPNGVHRNWEIDEIPKHLPLDILEESRIFAFQSPKAATKWHQKECKDILAHKGLSWLCMSYDGLMTKPGKELAKKFLSGHQTAMNLDEADAIKTPSAKRTRAITALGKLAALRRVMTGTPITQGPFDVYTLMRFLNEGFWKQFGLDSYVMFKRYFGIFKQGFGQGGRTFDQLLGYCNLEELTKMLEPSSSRVTKDQELDLPPKLYTKRYFDMTSKQWELYEQLKTEFIFMLENGDTVTAPLAITRMLRFQQITCGYIPVDLLSDRDEKKMHFIDEENQRIKLLMEVVQETPHKTIIWARFSKDIDLIMEALEKAGKKAVRYDGSTEDDDRELAKYKFQGKRPIMEDGKVASWEDVPPEEQADYFVGNPAAAGAGLTLHAARRVIYYNNSFKLRDRLQSEDRAHRIGQEHPVDYVDLIANQTIDRYIVNKLVSKKEIADTILGDDLKEWL